MSSAPRVSALDTAKTLATALAGAGAAVALQLPLPWFTGPLIAVASANMLGARLAGVAHARDVGQSIIGTALALYFTPEVVRALLQLAPWVGLTTLVMLVLGLAAAWVLRRATGESGTTSFFAMAIGGASEMAAQAERYGGRVDRVAAAHSLRIMLVALIVPFALQWAGVQGTDPYRPAAQDFNPIGFAVLAAATGGGAIALARLNAPNVWMIGPLLVACALTAGGYAFSSLPRPVLDGGQLLIGIALGARFSPEFFRAAPRYLTAVALITLGLLLRRRCTGWWLAGRGGLPVATAILATTPGGIGEMAITAKVLALGVPIRAAFHGVRLAILVLLAQSVFRVVRYALSDARSLSARVPTRPAPFRAAPQDPRSAGLRCARYRLRAAERPPWVLAFLHAVVYVGSAVDSALWFYFVISARPVRSTRGLPHGRRSQPFPSVPSGSSCRSNSHARRVACAPRAHPAYFRVSQTCRQAP